MSIYKRTLFHIKLLIFLGSNCFKSPFSHLSNCLLNEMFFSIYKALQTVRDAKSQELMNVSNGCDTTDKHWPLHWSFLKYLPMGHNNKSINSDVQLIYQCISIPNSTALFFCLRSGLQDLVQDNWFFRFRQPSVQPVLWWVSQRSTHFKFSFCCVFLRMVYLLFIVTLNWCICWGKRTFEILRWFLACFFQL